MFFVDLIFYPYFHSNVLGFLQYCNFCILYFFVKIFNFFSSFKHGTNFIFHSYCYVYIEKFFFISISLFFINATRFFNKQAIEKRKPVWFYRIRWRAKSDNEIDVGLFFEIAQENKIMYNQTPVNTLIEVMEKLKNGFCTNGYFSRGDEGEIDTNSFFEQSIELSEFIDKIRDKFDDHTSIDYTGIFYRLLRKFKRVNRSEHGRRGNEFNNIMESENVNCFIPSGSACFLKCNNYVFKKVFDMEYFEFVQSYKRRTNVMARCRIPGFCERYKIDIGIYDLKSKPILPRSLKKRDVCVYILKKPYCVVWKQNGKNALVKGVDEIERNFNYFKSKINEINLSQRIRYRFPKHEKIEQLEYVFVFDLETYNDQKFAEAYAAGLYDVNRLRDRWGIEI